MAIAGVLIVPGDYVFADGDGVVVIPATVAEEVLEMAVVLHRSAVVMEDLLIERRGVVGRMSRSLLKSLRVVIPVVMQRVRCDQYGRVV